MEEGAKEKKERKVKMVKERNSRRGKQTEPELGGVTRATELERRKNSRWRSIGSQRKISKQKLEMG